jgi:muconate cycloisomerase
MRILSAYLYSLRIPFKNPFTHSLSRRLYSDSIALKLTSDCGTVGFGEAVPREYVTGESVSSCLEHIQNSLLPALRYKDLPEPGDQGHKLLGEINSIIPDAETGGAIASNASRTALELALIDCIMKHDGKSLSCILDPISESVTYSAVISAESIKPVKKTAKYCQNNGMKNIKIKAGFGDDYERISSVREIMGDDVSLRIDANGAFDVKGALYLTSKIHHLRIDSIEQPIPRGDAKELARVRENSPIPVMVDESLITIKDAVDLIEKKSCDLFNLRISKNGGLFRTLQLADIARQAGIGIQIGCQVGETAILSAAGRHLSAHLPDLRFVEGSYGEFLLLEDISEEPVNFGFAGKAPLLRGNGLGIEVREDILEKYAVKIIPIKLG